VVAERIAAARARAVARGVPVNAALGSRAVEELAPLEAAAEARLERALASGRLSARGLRRVWRVALTLADLAGDDPPLAAEHVATALLLRSEPSFLNVRWAS
jgi:magnesium chelatase family protein